MTNILNFSSEKYRKKALSKKIIHYKTTKTAKDAFMLCIKNLPYEEIDNLCKEIEIFYKFQNNSITLSQEECYQLTQGKDTSTIKYDAKFKNILLNLAYQCIEDAKTIGSKKHPNGNSTTSWINHCLYQGQVAEILAKSQGLNSDTAKKLGILHDIGRKYTHTLLHTIAGFEYLIDEGWEEEAYICLTHSFLGTKKDNTNIFQGGRCCSCDPAIPGFYIEENSSPAWQQFTKKDDISFFLESYIYNPYDLIINMADLMTTSKGPTTPYNRIIDIATRTAPDPINRKYFKAEFCNLMLYFLENAKELEPGLVGKIKATTTTTDDQIDTLLKNISELFIHYYNNISNQQLNKNIQQKL